MSVLACDRRDCDSIMCDRLILGNQFYICNDCYDELVYHKDSWGTQLTEAEIVYLIERFMKTEPGTHEKRYVDVDEVFRRLTGDDE